MKKGVKLNDPVLVLNVNFEPLNVCTIKRAFGLMLAGKAEMIMNGRGHISTSTNVFDAPSVIKLSYMVKRPRPKIALSKREILRRDNHTCQYCGKQSSKMTIDHVNPRRLGGGHSWENLVAACPPCNRRKGGKRLEQLASMRLKRKPTTPKATAEYRFGHHMSRFEDWRQFIIGW